MQDKNPSEKKKIEGVDEGLSRVPDKSKYLVGIVFCYIFLVCFLCFGIRSTESAQEGRSLTAFPVWSLENFFNGNFTSGVTAWFSDTVPERDALMSAALAISDVKGFALTQDGEDIQFHNITAVGDADDSAKEEASGADDIGKDDAGALMFTAALESLLDIERNDDGSIEQKGEQKNDIS